MDPAGPAESRPALIRHARLGLTWQVIEVVEHWTHPHHYSVMFAGPAGECRRYQLTVHGPLPWRPGERGRFAVAVRLYGGRRGWWMSPVEE